MRRMNLARRTAVGFSIAFGALAASVVACGDSSSSDSPIASSGDFDSGRAAPVPISAAIDTVVRVHYPLAAHHVITLRTARSPHGTPLVQSDVTNPDAGTEATYTAHLSVPRFAPAFELSLYYDDTTPARGGVFRIAPGQQLDLYPHFFQQKGAYSQLIPSFHSNILNNNRIIWAYVPASYTENTLEKYPVLYMHDGQNLFDVAYTAGVTEQIAPSLDQGNDDGSIAEIIVIGIQSIARDSELAPQPDVTVPDSSPALGSQYVEMMTHELKPQVDAMLRTRPERENTGTMGSSLGGLISAFAGIAAPETFGVLGEMSASAFFDNDYVIQTITNAPGLSSETAPFSEGSFYLDGGLVDGSINVGFLQPERVYVDQGSIESLGDDRLAAAYRTRMTDPSRLYYFSEAGGAHNVVSWGRRFPGGVAFMFPGSRDGH